MVFKSSGLTGGGSGTRAGRDLDGVCGAGRDRADGVHRGAGGGVGGQPAHRRCGDVARRLGLSEDTIKSYDRRGYMPPADAKIGRVYGWLPESIDEWQRNRPGRGARTDLGR